MRDNIRQSLSAIKKTLFDDGGVEEVFRHARNLVVATLVIAAGINALEHTASMDVVGTIDPRIAGYFVAALGVLLFTLNLMDGLYKLSKAKRGMLLQLIVIAMYLLITVRVAQLIVALRTL